MKFVVPVITALLGAYAGVEGTSLVWRRVGIPIAVMLALGNYGWIGLVCAVLVGIVLSIGYGIPDEGDKGSVLGRWLKRDLFVRSFLGLLLMLSFLPVVISGAVEYGRWLWGGMILIAVWGMFGGDDVIREEGEIRFLGKKLLVEDLILYGALGSYAIWLSS